MAFTVLIGLLLTLSSAAAAPEPTPRAAVVQQQAGLQVLRADSAGVVLELHTPSYTLLPSPAGLTLQVPGYGSRESPGAAALPVVYAPLALPNLADLSLLVVADDEVVLPLPGHLAQAELPVLTSARREAGGGRREAGGGRRAAGLDPAAAAEVVRRASLRGQPLVVVALYPFQADAAAGVLRWHRTLRVELSFGNGPDAAPASDGSFTTLLRSQVLNSELLGGAAATQSQVTLGSDVDVTVPNNPCAATSGSVKLLVRQAGVYAVSLEELAAAGLNVSNPAGLHLYRGGCLQKHEVALEQEAGQLRFYGTPSTSRFGDTAMYWLREEATPGLRMTGRDATPGSGQLRIAYEAVAGGVVLDDAGGQRRRLYDWAYPGADGDHFFGGDLRFGAPMTVSLSTTDLQQEPAALDLSVQGVTTGLHEIALRLNGALLPPLRWTGDTLFTTTIMLNQGLVSGGEQLLVLSVGQELPPDVVQLDRATLRHQALLRASGNRLIFSGAAGRWRYQVADWSGSTPLLYAVGDPARPVRLVGGSGDQGSLLFEEDTPAAEVYALSTPGGELRFGSGEAGGIVADNPSQLANGAADYLIIGYGPFLSATAPLAAHYESRGLRVATVDVQEIYDHWSGGALDPEAIRSFLRYAYSQWEGPPPTYVLLVGDGSYDFRNELGLGWANYVPPYFISGDPWTNEASCDSCYGRLDSERASDDPLPELLVGRLPVSSLAQATIVVSKTLGYLTAPPEGGWRNRGLFLADNYYDEAGVADGAGDFASYTERAISALPPGFEARRLLYDPSAQRRDLPGFYGEPEPLRKELRRSLDDGAALVSYIGHSTYWQWAFTAANDTPPYLWYLYDADSLQNGGRLPVLFSMTCLTGFFQQPDLPTTDERLLTLAAGGSVASFSPSGLGVAHGHDQLQRALLTALYNRDPAVRSLGSARLAGDLALLTSGCCGDLSFTYQLFGDPALNLVDIPNNVWLPLVAR